MCCHNAAQLKKKICRYRERQIHHSMRLLFSHLPKWMKQSFRVLFKIQLFLIVIAHSVQYQDLQNATIIWSHPNGTRIASHRKHDVNPFPMSRKNPRSGRVKVRTAPIYGNNVTIDNIFRAPQTYFQFDSTDVLVDLSSFCVSQMRVNAHMARWKIKSNLFATVESANNSMSANRWQWKMIRSRLGCTDTAEGELRYRKIGPWDAMINYVVAGGITHHIKTHRNKNDNVKKFINFY